MLRQTCLEVLHCDVLDAAADALPLAIDGAAHGMEGNVARQFARRWSAAWEEIAAEIRYPLPLGRVFEVELDSGYAGPFRLVILASTFHHRETLTDRMKLGIVRTAMENALRAPALPSTHAGHDRDARGMAVKDRPRLVGHAGWT